MSTRRSRESRPALPADACHPPAAAPAHAPSRTDTGPDPALLKRVARIEGQVRGVSGMLREGRYCVDILTQLAAVQQALRGVGRAVLERHLQTCVAAAMRSRRPGEAERVSRELGDLLDRWNR